MAMDTATILDLLTTRIEALTPRAQSSADDRFRVTLGDPLASAGKRQTFITADGAIRKPRGGSTCSDWETTLEISVLYPDTMPARGQRGAYSHALQDAEDMLSDLHTWASTTDKILAIEPSPATVASDGEGRIESVRSIFIQFERVL